MNKEIIEEGKELLSKMRTLDTLDDESDLTLNGVWEDMKRFLKKFTNLENVQ